MLVTTIVIIHFLIFLFFALCYGLFSLVAGWMKIKIKFLIFCILSIITCVILDLCLLYGYEIGRFKYQITHISIIDDRIPEAFDGYKIIQISDLHLGGFKNHEAFVDTIVCAVNALKPDLICFTGDLVSISANEALPFVLPLRSLNARDGVISVLGNHDYSVYNHALNTREEHEADFQSLISIERDSMDWNLLLNEHIFIRHGHDSISIIGIENQSCGIRQVVRRGDLASSLKGTEGSFQILLSHDPTQWSAEVVNQTSIPLTLSGHTHAMQFRLMGWTPCRWFYPNSDGFYSQNNQTLYVNIGLGQLLPFRIGAKPEITLFTLKRKNHV